MTIAGPSQKTNSGTTATGGNSSYDASYLSTPLPTIQKLTSGTTYTTPAGVQWLRVKMVGAGGGGGGSCTTAANNAGAGGSGGVTTFGTSLLTANGGGGGGGVSALGGVGGTYTITLPAYGTGVIGGIGCTTPFTSIVTGGTLNGGGASGASSPFGGQGSGGVTGGGNGFAASINSGSGGGSGGNPSAGYSGGGGGSGGFIDAIIPTPSTSYTYVIGAGGTVGAAGTSGFTGGLGGTGYIEVTEYYTGLVVGTSQAVIAANKIYSGPSSGAASTPAFRGLNVTDMPTTCIVRVVNNTTQSLTTATETTVNFQTTNTDNLSTWSSNTTFTAPTTGFYIVTLDVEYAPNSAGQRYIAYKIGASASVQLGSVTFGVVTYDTRNTGSTILSLTAGNTVVFRAYQDSGGALNIQSSSAVLSIGRIG